MEIRYQAYLHYFCESSDCFHEEEFGDHCATFEEVLEEVGWEMMRGLDEYTDCPETASVEIRVVVPSLTECRRYTLDELGW